MLGVAPATYDRRVREGKPLSQDDSDRVARLIDVERAATRVFGDDASARQVVEHVYTDVDEKLWDAAEWSVQAQLDYLRA